MIKTEAQWLLTTLQRLSPKLILNYGSSTLEFRTKDQSFINETLAGFEVVHVDMKSAEGVDVVCNLEKDDLPEKVHGYVITPPVRFHMDSVIKRSVGLLTNVLEHVRDRDAVMRNVRNIPTPHIIVSVPETWQYHPDPIDTMWRPSRLEMIEYVSKFGYRAEESACLEDKRGYVSVGLFKRS